MIPPLMKRAREIYDLENPPERKQGCKDCGMVEKMGGLLGLLKKNSSRHVILETWGDLRWGVSERRSEYVR